MLAVVDRLGEITYYSVDQYNLKDLAILRDGNGKEYRPNTWDAPSGGAW